MESAELKLWPEVIFPEASGPSEPSDRSTPVTLKVLVVMDDLPPEPPSTVSQPPGVADPAAGKVPDSFRSVRLSALAAADTSFSPAICVTDEDFSVPSPALCRTLRLIFVPAVGLLPEPPPKPNLVGPPEPAVGCWVTVTSVPTPYRACRTVPWLAETPAEAAVTVMTRPMPMARPRAMKIACRILRRSSRRR